MFLLIVIVVAGVVASTMSTVAPNDQNVGNDDHDNKAVLGFQLITSLDENHLRDGCDASVSFRLLHFRMT